MKNRLSVDCCIVGMGPAGIGVALALETHNKDIKLVCIDAGILSEERKCAAMQNHQCVADETCNIISGFGGCSLLSGGKLSLYPAGSKFADILGSVNAAKEKMDLAKEKIFRQIDGQPQVYRTTDVDVNIYKKRFNKMGFDYKYYEAYSFSEQEIRSGYSRTRKTIEKYGRIIMGCNLVNAVRCSGKVLLYCKYRNDDLVIETDIVVFSSGRLGREMLKTINRSLSLSAKPSRLDVGVRLEMPTAIISDVIEDHGDLKLMFGDARTYCVCRGGYVTAYYMEGVRFTEGHCDIKQVSDNTNLAILTRIAADQHNEAVFEEIKARSLAHNVAARVAWPGRT